MRESMSICFLVAAATSIAAASPGPLSAQVPEPSSTPRLAVPARGTAVPAVQAPGQPTVAPAAETPGQPPAPAVGAAPPPSGVTQLPPAAAPPATSSSSQAAMAAPARGYAAGRFGLTLEGASVGWLRSTEGGSATAEVVVEKGPGNIPAKHIAGIRYEEISLVTDLQSKALNDWIAASWKGSAPRKSGSIQGADYNYTVVSEREFTNALITETTMPALDAASKDAAHITVKLAPEYTRLKPGSGAKAQGPVTKTQKNWLPSSFRFEMAGLDGGRINKIDSFTVRQTMAENPVGELREYLKEPGKIGFPNLKITLAASAAQTWLDWHEDFVVKGNNGDDKERSGAIVYLATSLKEELGRVNLHNCGIYRLAPQKVEAGNENIQRMIAELYCERMELVVNSAGK